MCIAVPMRIVEAEGLSAVARREGAPDLKVDTSLVGELAPGDWVLVFRESVIRTVSEEDRPSARVRLRRDGGRRIGGGRGRRL